MFAVFAGLYYYPKGGWADFYYVHWNVEEAVYAAETLVSNREDWSEVINLTTQERVRMFHKSDYRFNDSY